MIIEIIAIACLTVLFVEAEPMQRIKHFIFKDIKDYESYWWWRLINCCLCSGLYIGFALTLNIYSALIISVLAEFIHKKLTEGRL